MLSVYKKTISSNEGGELFPYFSYLGLAVLNHTLTPRMRACHVAIEAMKDHLDAVYDVTVAYEGTQTATGQRRPAPSMPGEQVLKKRFSI